MDTPQINLIMSGDMRYCAERQRNRHQDHLIVSNQPFGTWTPATPGKPQLYCRPFGDQESDLFLIIQSSFCPKRSLVIKQLQAFAVMILITYISWGFKNPSKSFLLRNLANPIPCIVYTHCSFIASSLSATEYYKYHHCWPHKMPK